MSSISVIMSDIAIIPLGNAALLLLTTLQNEPTRNAIQ
jgi:hypothetical protein